VLSPMRRLLSFSMVILLTCSLIAAAKSELQIDEINLERTSCYGTCPQYKLTIHSDGTVLYKGKDFVKEKGAKKTRVSQSDLRKLARKINAIRFFNLEEKYNSQEIGGASIFVTDQPTQIVTIRAGDRTKSVEDYFGSPKGLHELEELIDQVTNSSVWTGVRSDISDIPYYDSFPLNRRVRFRALLEHYRTGGDSKRVSGYLLMFMKNPMSFDLEAHRDIDLSSFDGYIVDAIGHIRKSKTDNVFVVTEIRRVRRYP